MHLSSQEKRWLPWFGNSGKLSMGLSCLINRSHYQQVEQTFECFAESRKHILIGWTQFKWDILARLASLSSKYVNTPDLSDVLQQSLQNTDDFTELFVVDDSGLIINSTHSSQNGRRLPDSKALSRGLEKPFLHGPFVDDLTQDIGPSTSKFHDRVTLMFYQPLTTEDGRRYCLCGRIPNDVMSDLIQREAGHVYPESGDNYVFMVSAEFDRTIKPGTALSRSRFEDDSFSGGENLKSGVSTGFGTVRIREHTEFEVLFTDPATNQLHPGVRETISKGNNLFVTYPGYSDYRHIPVIGAGVTFQLPGSPDLWGMMCEADLEEVYRFRPLSLQMFTTGALWGGSLLAATTAAIQYWSLPNLQAITLQALAFLITLMVVTLKARSAEKKIASISNTLFAIAEKGAPLSLRVNNEGWRADQCSELARWVNSFVDRTEKAGHTLASASQNLTQSAESMLTLTKNVSGSSSAQSASASSTSIEVNSLIQSIGQVAYQASATKDTSEKARVLSAGGRTLVESVAGEMSLIADSMSTTQSLVKQLEDKSKSISEILKVISDIADQTNLLALNATIEAARAGEHGRGFSVVAEEVKQLSDRTSKSTADISEMINSILHETSQVSEQVQGCNALVQRGEEAMQKASSSLTEIHSGSSEAFTMVEEIADLADAQDRAGKQIEANIATITSAAQKNSVSTQRAEDAAYNLATLGDALANAARSLAAAR